MPQLTDVQVETLRQLTSNGNDGYWEAYIYLISCLETSSGNEDYIFWLEKAAEINSNYDNSQANSFIRGVTRAGLLWDGATEIDIQRNSQIIGAKVIGDVLEDGVLPPLADLIGFDVSAAIDVGGQTIGGWGGAFYYWNFQLAGSPYSVGETILQEGEYEKFIAINAKAALDVMAEFGLSFDQVVTGIGAQVDSATKAIIAARVLAVQTGVISSPVGDPNNIDGYVPTLEGDAVVGWTHNVNGQSVSVVDPALLQSLNEKREDRVRLTNDPAFNSPNPDQTKHVGAALSAAANDSAALNAILKESSSSLVASSAVQLILANIMSWYSQRLAVTELDVNSTGSVPGILNLQLAALKQLQIDISGKLQDAIDYEDHDSQADPHALSETQQLVPKQMALQLLHEAIAESPQSVGTAKVLFENAVKVVWADAAPPEKTAADTIAHYYLEAADGTDIEIDGHSTESSAIVGGSAADELRGGEANDVIIGRGGNDTIDGADGNDIIFGGDNADTITGGVGNDYIEGGAGNDTIYADIEGSQKDEGNDFIFAGIGDDKVFSGGSDIVSLGDGNDEIHFVAPPSSEGAPATQTVVWGGAGSDSFYFEGDAHVLSIAVNGMTEDLLKNLSTSALFEMFNDGREWGYNYILINIEAQDKIFVDGTQLTTASVTPNTSDSGLDRFDYEFDHTGIGFNNEEYDYYIPVSKTEMETTSRDDYYEMPGFEGEYSVRLGGGDYGYSMGAGSFTMEGFFNGAAGVNFEGDGLWLWSQTTKTVQQIDVTEWDPIIYYLDEHKAYWQVAEYEPEGDPVVTVDTNEGYHLRPEGFDGASAPTIDLNPFQIINVDGTAGDDTMVASSSGERFNGGAGSDTVDYSASTEGVTVDLAAKRGESGARGDQYHSVENVVGSAQVDQLFGDAESNVLSGGGGTDYLFGDGGADHLSGDDGDDYLYGWDGNDILSGGVGNDTLSGGFGNDMLDGGDGDDALSLEGQISDYAFFRNVDGSITVASGNEGIDVLSNIEEILLQTGISVDLGELVSSAAPSNLTGTQGADSIAGSEGDDLISSFGGDDTVEASDGSDIVDTGEGYDIVQFAGQLSEYSVIAVDADRILVRGAGSDTLINKAERLQFGASDSIDVVSFLSEFAPKSIIGTSHGETLVGGSGSDSIYGGGGSDVLIFNGGNDHLDGGDGNDTALINGSGSVTVSGGSGTDTVVLTGERLNYEIDYYEAGNLSLHSTELFASISGAEFLVFDNGETQETVRISDFASMGLKLIGTDGRDYLFGTARDDTFEGKQGNDDLYGGDGNDIYRYSYGDGSDRIYDGADQSVDTLKLLDLNASDILAARNGDDLLIYIINTSDIITVGGQWFQEGYQGLEKLVFADGSSWDREAILAISEAPIYNGPGDDIVRGTSGNDLIGCGPGNDRLEGGAGEDIYVYNRGDGTDYIDDEANEQTSVDTLKFEDLNASDVSAVRNGINLDITVLSTGDVISIDEQWYNPNAFWGLERIEFADGTFWDRTAIMAIQRGPIVGTGGDDFLSGTSGDDVLQGLAGNDTLNGGDGNDSHFGGDGDDLLIGNVGDDSFDGGNGNDTLDFTYYSNDHDIDLALGKVLFSGGIFETAINIENVLAGAGANHIIGSSGDNRLSGGSGNDTLIGGAGNDVLVGGEGDDSLSGGDGDDRLSGGVGADMFDGGAGNDIADFSYSAVDWTLNLQTGHALADGTDEGLISIEGLVGSAGNDTLVGNSQDNVLDGWAGNDLLTGAAGNDTFVFHGVFGQDIVSDFAIGEGSDDLIDTDAFADFASVLAAATQVGNDILIVADANSSILLKNTVMVGLHQDDFRFAAAA